MKKMRCFLLAVFALTLFGLASAAAAAEIYKYVDDRGVTNFVDNMDKVPDKYRDRAKLVKKEIMVDKQHSLLPGAFEKRPYSWADFVVYDKSGEPVGLNLKKMFWAAMWETKLIYWFGLEFALMFVALGLLIYFRHWPTASGRWGARISVFAGYMIIGGIVFGFFVLPSLKLYLATTRGYISAIVSNAQLDQQSTDALFKLDKQLDEFQSKLP
jgi:hypothetical protein